MQSARKKTKVTKASLLKPEDFKDRLGNHVRVAKELDKLIIEVQKEKSGKLTKNNREYNVSKLKTLKTVNLKELGKLSTAYRRTYMRVKADREGGANGGFRQPLQIGESLLSFFRDADLGTVGGRGDNSGQRLQSILTFLVPPPNGTPIASRSILTALFALYAKRHNLAARAAFNQGKPVEQHNRQLLGTDEYMNSRLGNIFSAYEQESAVKLQKKGLQDNQRKPPITKSGKERKYFRDDGVTPNWNDFEHVFNRNNFSYSSLQGIFSLDVTPLNAKGPNGETSEYLVSPPELASAYTKAVKAAEENGTLGSTGNTFYNIAERVANGAPTQALQLRAGLDHIHSLVAAVSATYNVVGAKPKPKSKAKKAAVAQ